MRRSSKFKVQSSKCCEGPRLPVVLVLLLGAASGVLGGSASSSNREGTRLYADKKYDEALKKFSEAQAARPDLLELKYNEANALYKLGKGEDAAKLFAEAMSIPDTQKREWAVYNLGNAFFNAGDLENAVKSYVQALRLDPTDKQAKINLEMSLKRQQEQQEQSQQQDQKQPPPEEKPQPPKEEEQDMEEKQMQALLEYLKEKEKDDMQKQQRHKATIPAVDGKDW